MLAKRIFSAGKVLACSRLPGGAGKHFVGSRAFLDTEPPYLGIGLNQRCTRSFRLVSQLVRYLGFCIRQNSGKISSRIFRNPAANLPRIPVGIPTGNPAGIGIPAGNPARNPAGNPLGSPAGIPVGIPAGIPSGNPADRQIRFGRFGVGLGSVGSVSDSVRSVRSVRCWTRCL